MESEREVLVTSSSATQLSRQGRVILTVMGMVTLASVLAILLSRVSSTTSAMSRKPRHYRILAFGDSLTAGYVRGGSTFYPYADALQKSLDSWVEESEDEIIVDHVGKPGWTSEELFGILPGDLPYHVMIILAGTNDIGLDMGTSVENIIAHLRDLHDAALRRGVQRTIALEIPQSAYQLRNERARQTAENVNSALKQWNDKRITFVPFPFPFDKADTRWNQDGLHLSAEGYSALGLYLAPFVQKELKKVV